jgi:O-antigen ligase
VTDTTPGKLYTDFEYPLKNAIFFGMFFLTGVVLMYFGYFTPYSEIGSVVYFTVLVCVGILYCVYFGLIAPPHISIYNWLLMFFFFPKKELKPDMPSLMNVGFGFETVSISMYTILDVFIIGTIAIAVLARRKSFVCQKMFPNIRRLVFFSYMIILIGLIHILIIPADTDIVATQQDYTNIIATQQYGIMFLSLFPLIAAVILFKGAMYFINTREAVERIFFYALASSFLLVIEYILSRYTSILPQGVVYYALNYRGAFRSVLHSGDLLVSLILILGSASCLYFLLSRRKVIYGVLCILFILLILLTYNRGSVLAAMAMSAIVLMVHYRLTIKKTLLAFAIILSITSFLIDYNSLLSTLLEKIDFVDAVMYYAEYRESGILSLDSMSSRAESQIRAIDVFLNYPIFGVGPGLAQDFMNSNSVASFLGEEGLTVGHNPHNLYISVLTEYGLFGIGFVLSLGIVIICFYRSITKGSKRNTYRNQDSYRLTRLLSYAAIVGYLIYYLFQAVPLIYGLIFLLLRLTLLDDRFSFTSQAMQHE